MTTDDRVAMWTLAGIDDLTPELLLTCLEDDENLLYGFKPADVVEAYFNNDDHGFGHSAEVYYRCLEILHQSPLLAQLAMLQFHWSKDDLDKILMLSAIFHDMSRFFGAGFDTHEAKSAKLADHILGVHQYADAVSDCIVHHDYFNLIVNGILIPVQAMGPLSEIFRLADCTSLPPEEELERYYKTGQRLQPDWPIFDPSIPDEVRFDLRNSASRASDYLGWFLIFFSMQSTDFVYGETREAYAYWARGKQGAVVELFQWCLKDECVEGTTPVDPIEIRQVISRFCKYHNLVLTTV